MGAGAPAPAATPGSSAGSRAGALAPTPSPSLAGRGATGIDSGLGRTESRTNLEKAGKQFEAIFTGMMLKAARQAKLADPLFDSKAIDTFTEMQDGQVAKAMAEHTPLGIGKAMTDFLSKSQADLNASAAGPPA